MTKKKPPSKKKKKPLSEPEVKPEEKEIEEEKETTKEGLPDLPGPEKKSEEEDSGKESYRPGSEISGVELEEVCRDLVAIPFEIWHALKPKIEPLSETEKKRIAVPLARLAVKYDIERFAKDEILLFAFLAYSISKRVDIKKHAKNHRREKGKGKDHPSEKPDQD